jgi:GT2 family glycosyltransferase
VDLLLPTPQRVFVTSGANSPVKCAFLAQELQLTIIIVSYNTREITRACLSSLRRAGLQLSYEVVAVDNASSDGSPEMIQQEFPEVTLVRNTQNLMFAKANNQGMRIARGKYILLLNSDTLVEPGNLERLYDFIERRQPEVGCVGPRVLNAAGTTQFEGEAFDSYWYVLCSCLFIDKLPLPMPIKKSLLPLGFPRGLVGRVREVGWVSGCCMMFPRGLFGVVGGFDEDFVFYCEDAEFCYRLHKHGFHTWVVPAATITHLGGASWLAAKRLSPLARPELPGRLLRLLQFYRKTSGVRQKIRSNRLRIALLTAVLPLMRLRRSKLFEVMTEKRALHVEENSFFRQQLGKNPPNIR